MINDYEQIWILMFEFNRLIFLIFLGFFLAKSISLYPISTINFSLIVHQLSNLVLFLLMF